MKERRIKKGRSKETKRRGGLRRKKKRTRRRGRIRRKKTVRKKE